MEKEFSIKKALIVGVLSLICINVAYSQGKVGQTEITKWQYGKKGAISITYDDGTINQFRKAIPIMNRLGFPGTFFINTGSIPGSKYKGQFIGRPINQIIEETKTIPTNKDNVFERASAASFLEFRGAGDHATRAGAQIDAGRMEAAYKILDELYQKVINGELEPQSSERITPNNADILTWDMIKTYASQGHEFASHMVTHPYVSALDEPNLLYELEKSREEILNHLGLRHTFSAECPYGSEDERAMQYAYKVYPALRNRMPEEYLLELNRGSRKTPVNSDYEYVQWQRGILSRTTLDQMKAWADTTATQNNIWLVLVLHGIDGIGWESIDSQLADDYFSYIKSRDNDLWVATFGDVARYMKERMSAKVNSSQQQDNIQVSLTHSLNEELYDLPLTLKTHVSFKWKEANVKQGESAKKVEVQHEGNSSFIIYQAIPNKQNITISMVE